MNSTALPTCAALAIQFGLGLVVFQANRRRESNQCFLLLSAVISAWLTSVYYGLNTRNPAVAEFCIREASAAGALILAGFNLLRLSIREREKGWRGILHHSRAWLVITIAIVGLCQTKSFL